jgi:hypothetical protein
MIEVVSHPPNLADWDETSRDQPFYLELFGETKPLIEQNFSDKLGLANQRAYFNREVSYPCVWTRKLISESCQTLAGSSTYRF